ncbi:hypothetical protein GCM10011583_72170 [Streptomyces camponoticapitis]|uniref:Secreted protein n=1 Tax=Streptomyces camponoticapitis TaxID=1616125 RepID=A0ABQ2EWY4_9ACTN|nr:hypothetical protein [Streptomyces camponoticapitis]GGK29831.1 hypothetical protein GCM10011583_72170 [Streptomyces camponoticapitis]
MRHGFAALVLATVALTAAYTAPAQAAANPSPVPPAAESLLKDGLTIEGPLINNLDLQHLL